MLDFKKLKTAVHRQFEMMANKGDLFRTEVGGDELWDLYIASFPPDTNPIFKERTEHDCQCCKQFIKACGNVVMIKKNKLVSLWDITVDDPAYQAVVNALATLVKSKSVYMPFLRTEATLGTDFNHQLTESGEVVRWDHFYFKLPSQFVERSDRIGKRISNANAAANVFKRGLEELSLDSFETVIELIKDKNIYRGEEHQSAVETFYRLKKQFDKLRNPEYRNNFAWYNSTKIGGLAKFRNSVIGTLLVDLSEGKDLTAAVKSFEDKVAPHNYKRPKALITKAMIKRAQETVEELGLTSALTRRHATIDDITINNVIFADRTARQQMSKNVFDELVSEIPVKPKKYDKVAELTIDEFVENVLPTAKTIELQLENKHENNLVTLTAPEDQESEKLFKWNNNFSWAYNHDLTDSAMKQRVKAAGGNINAVLRFSIQWNDGDNNQNDFDAHAIEPNGLHIYFQNRGLRHRSSGMLDVDVINPGHKVAVENITWTDIDKMLQGEYHLFVHNYSHNGGRTGFTAEIEYNGTIHTFVYDRELRQGEKVTVAKIKFSKTDGIKFIEALPSTVATKELWNINTNNFHRVGVIMNSPNHWDGEETGNKHWFFMLEDCQNPNPVRGFFNEYLNNDLMEHRKVFEVLGSKMKAEPTEKQLSGLGFSSTKRNSVLCRVTGNSTRVIRINF